jgi:hypothetical protein
MAAAGTQCIVRLQACSKPACCCELFGCSKAVVEEMSGMENLLGDSWEIAAAHLAYTLAE